MPKLEKIFINGKPVECLVTYTKNVDVFAPSPPPLTAGSIFDGFNASSEVMLLVLGYCCTHDDIANS